MNAPKTAGPFALIFLAASALELSASRASRSKSLALILDVLAKWTAKIRLLILPASASRRRASGSSTGVGDLRTRSEVEPMPLPPDAFPQSEKMRALLERKLTFLKRAGLFGSDTKGGRITRAATLTDLRNAYQLVHNVYLGTGYIHPEPAGIRLRIFETSSETATFVAKVNGSVVGVLSIVGDSPEAGLPSDSAFKPELDVLRSQGRRLCEATNQAVLTEYRKSAVPTELMRCAVAHMTNAGYDESIAAVSPSHDGFYELLGFREVGSKRSYSHKVHDPVVALSMDINQYRSAPTETTASPFIHQFLASENHFLAYVGEWERQARRLFLDTELLEQLFFVERDFISECTEEEIAVLRQRWGSELFSAVTGRLFVPGKDQANKRSTRQPTAHGPQ